MKKYNYLTAGILAILLGGIGAHNFYLRRICRGVLDILFWWTCIPAIIGLIMGIIWLTNEDQFNEQFNNSTTIIY